MTSCVVVRDALHTCRNGPPLVASIEAQGDVFGVVSAGRASLLAWRKTSGPWSVRRHGDLSAQCRFDRRKVASSPSAQVASPRSKVEAWAATASDSPALLDRRPRPTGWDQGPMAQLPSRAQHAEVGHEQEVLDARRRPNTTRHVAVGPAGHASLRKVVRGFRRER